MKNMNKKLSTNFEKFALWVSVSYFVVSFYQKFKSLFKDVNNLNDSLTDISKKK